MCKIKDFNAGLNSSSNYQNNLKNEYKKQVNVIVENVIKTTTKKQTCCVIGTGKMEDFSLSFFTENFDKIVLSDVDITSVKSSITKNHTNIILEAIEYTGFQESKFFEDFYTLKNMTSFDEIDLYLRNKFKIIEEYTFMEEYIGKINLLYISPIYTQLVYNQVLYECSLLRSKGHPEHLLKYLENMMLDEMVGVISRFNNNILGLVRSDGYVIALSDIFQMDIGSAFDSQMKEAIGNNTLVEKIYSEYVSKYGMGLGDFGLYDLDQKMQLQSSEWMIWPFSKKTNFAVKCNVYKKN